MSFVNWKAFIRDAQSPTTPLTEAPDLKALHKQRNDIEKQIQKLQQQADNIDVKLKQARRSVLGSTKMLTSSHGSLGFIATIQFNGETWKVNYKQQGARGPFIYTVTSPRGETGTLQPNLDVFDVNHDGLEDIRYKIAQSNGKWNPAKDRSVYV